MSYVFRPPTIAAILASVCAFYHVSITDIKGHTRTANLVRPRQVAMYLAAKHTTHSLPQVGRFVGGKDHTTVLHARDKIKGLLAAGDASVIGPVNSIKLSLGIS